MRRSSPIPVPVLSARYSRTLMEIVPSPASWLLYFMQTDLRTIPQKGEKFVKSWRDLQDEMVVFSLPPHWDSMNEMASIADLEHRPGKKEIEKIQRELKRGVAGLLKSPEGRVWRIPNLQPTSVLVRLLNGRIVRSYRSKSIRDRFLMVAADLLEKVGERIKCCPKCGRLFPAVKRQGYCSQRCSQTVRTRKYRATHGEALRERRRERNNAKRQAEKVRQAALQIAQRRFFEFLKVATKNALTSGEQTRLRPILRKIGGWKTVEMWEKKRKAGASPEEIWDGLSKGVKQIFESV